MSVPVMHEGDVETVTATFTDENGDLTDPTTITLKVMDPSGNTNTYTYSGGTITKDDVGVYSKDLTWDEPGEWTGEWISTGTGAGVEPFQRRVIPSRF
jgi:hypothetical protein